MGIGSPKAGKSSKAILELPSIPRMVHNPTVQSVVNVARS